MKYAYISNEVVREIVETDQDIRELYHPSMPWAVVVGQVEVGYSFKNGIFSLPVPEVVDENKLAMQERAWRDSELVRADEGLNKVQDSDPKAKGTVSQWREYRKALRVITELPGFPVSHTRPSAPDV